MRDSSICEESATSELCIAFPIYATAIYNSCPMQDTESFDTSTSKMMIRCDLPLGLCYNR
jgi:hypothetical protein